MQSLRHVLYALKRNWGTTISYVQLLSSESDDRTGERQVNRIAFDLPAVRLPQSQVRKFIQDIGYLAANKNFTYGAFNDFTTVMFIINRVDMPAAMNLNLNGWINHGPSRYERKSFIDLLDQAYIVVGQAVEGQLTYQTINLRCGNTLQVNHSITQEQN